MMARGFFSFAFPLGRKTGPEEVVGSETCRFAARGGTLMVNREGGPGEVSQ